MLVVFVKYSNSLLQVLLFFYPKLAVASVLIVITSRANIARSVAAFSHGPQSFGSPYTSTNGKSSGRSEGYTSLVETYSQAKLGETAGSSQATDLGGLERVEGAGARGA